MDNVKISVMMMNFHMVSLIHCIYIVNKMKKIVHVENVMTVVHNVLDQKMINAKNAKLEKP